MSENPLEPLSIGGPTQVESDGRVNQRRKFENRTPRGPTVLTSPGDSPLPRRIPPGRGEWGSPGRPSAFSLLRRGEQAPPQMFGSIGVNSRGQGRRANHLRVNNWGLNDWEEGVWLPK